MKKFICTLLCMVLAVSVFTGCSQNSGGSTTTTTTISPMTLTLTAITDDTTTPEAIAQVQEFMNNISKSEFKTQVELRLMTADEYVNYIERTFAAANAQAEAVNLARILADSEQIYIPNISESIDQIENETQNVISSAAAVPSASSDGLLNINQASESELMQLPGIGQVKAAAIVTYRNSNGPFSSIEEIKNVPGIKEAAFEKIKGMITVF